MGGCASKPTDLDDPKNEYAAPVQKPAESDVVVKEVEVDSTAQKWKRKDRRGTTNQSAPHMYEEATEAVTEPAVKEAPLVDLSESPQVEEKTEVSGLAPEITELVTSDAPKAEANVVEKEKTLFTEEKNGDKTKEMKNPEIVADAS